MAVYGCALLLWDRARGPSGVLGGFLGVLAVGAGNARTACNRNAQQPRRRRIRRSHGQVRLRRDFGPKSPSAALTGPARWPQREVAQLLISNTKGPEVSKLELRCRRAHYSYDMTTNFPGFGKVKCVHSKANPRARRPRAAIGRGRQCACRNFRGPGRGLAGACHEPMTLRTRAYVYIRWR